MAGSYNLTRQSPIRLVGRQVGDVKATEAVVRTSTSAVVSACTYNEATSAEARNIVEPTSSAYVDYVWSSHLKSRGLVSVSNEE